MSSTRVPSKLVAFLIVVFMVSTGLSTVYANSLQNQTLPFIENNNSAHELLGYEELFDRGTSLNDEVPPRAPCIIDNETWDIIVPDDFPTIQEAVNNASEAQVYRIFVKSGVYKENVVISTDGIVLHGEQKVTTVIDGNNNDAVITIECQYLHISGFTVSNGTSGIYLNQSSGNLIQDTIIKENVVGVIIENHSHANNITENQVIHNLNDGIVLNGFCTGNIIVANTISENSQCGITISSVCRLNTVVSNIISHHVVGINVTGVSDGNYFYSNSLVDNSLNAFDTSENSWDNGKIGNFWDDYTGIDNNYDGIGDTPYSIAGGENKDNYPLMLQPLEIQYVQIDTITKNSQSLEATASYVTYTGTTLYVPNDYLSIQEAVNHAADGDVIHVGAGMYYEHVVVTKQVNIEGDGADVTCIDGSGDDEHVLKITADHVAITGFTIQHCSVGFSGIRVLGDACTIHENILTMCGGGVELWEVADAVLHNNSIDDNTWGVYAHHSYNCIINNNSFSGNLYGMELGYSTVRIANNSIANHNVYGILQLWSNQAIIEGNRFENHSNIAYQLYSSHHNIIKGNDVTDNEYGLALYESKDNTIIENNVSYNRYGVYFWFQSNNNSMGNNVIFSNFYGINLGQSLYNTLTSNTIINNTRTGVLLGFSSHHNTLMKNTISDNPNEGVFIFSSLNNTISDNTIARNYNGLLLSSYSSSIIIDNNISYNFNRGIFCWYSSSMIIDNNISHNGYYGIYCAYSPYNHIEGNNISDNDYCGIELSSYSSSDMIKNNITDNRMAGIHVWKSRVNIIKNNISGSIEDGIILKNASNCTIIGNQICNITWEGLELWNSYLNKVNENNISENGEGGIIVSYGSHDNIISNNRVVQNVYAGIYFSDFSYSNKIIGNNISNTVCDEMLDGVIYGDGIFFDGSWGSCKGNSIEHNIISNNRHVGIHLYSANNSSMFNLFLRNNIIGNNESVTFSNSYPNVWFGNYWDDWNKTSPKPIYGKLKLERLNNMIIPWVQFDWHPAQEPYEIPSWN